MVLNATFNNIFIGERN